MFPSISCKWFVTENIFTPSNCVITCEFFIADGSDT